MSDMVVMFGYVQIFSRLLTKTLSIGDVTFHVRNLSSLQDSLMALFRRMNDLMESSLQLKEAYQLFQTKPAFPDGTIKLSTLTTGPEILLRNVDFHYPNSERKVIENLNLKIRPGEKVAIVGHNGAGKTTLVKLLSRIYQTSAGEILINGTNINELAIDSLYKNMGVIFQDYNNYSMLTVRDNIYMGRSDEPLNETSIRLAAQAADADDFIQEYPQKYNQILSEKFKDGVRPSTGQWQKLAIARFFYRNAPLVIFDEPTAAIDPVSEYNIFNKIYEFFENKTVIIISHKFSTVRNADRILVMEKGQIIEEGTHDHLLALNGKYAQAFMLQAKGYANKTEEEVEIEQGA
jgi:ATP-binding cassette subfamily B protein